MKVYRTDKLYTRKSVSEDSKNMYIFTDNTDRDSGKNLIDADSWYCKKYGVNKHYPTMTTAIIRGLPNAYPITTQRWYNAEHKGVNGRWTDGDYEEFVKIIDNDFEEISKNLDKFDNVIFPQGGIFNSKISAISMERTPKLFQYLRGKCVECFSKYITK